MTNIDNRRLNYYKLAVKGKELLELYKRTNVDINYLITELEKIATIIEESDQDLADSFQLEINDLEIINAIKYSDGREIFLDNEKVKIDKIILLISKMFEEIMVNN